MKNSFHILCFYVVQKCILAGLLNLFCVPTHATTYYLSNNGNDANSGISADEPWQTITQLNTVVLQPGDSVLFLSGNIFRGQVNVLSSGSADDPVYFGTYGGANPAIISGAELITGWTVYSGSIYSAPFPQVAVHLFAAGKRMTPARFPNSGFLTHQEGIASTGFVDSSLTQADDFWTGSMVHFRTSDQLWETREVTGFSGDSVVWDGNSQMPVYGGYGYYFDHQFEELDSSTEWDFLPALQTIYFFAPGGVDPGTLPVEASVYDYGISLMNNSSNIVIHNIRFEKENKAGIGALTSSGNILIDSCAFILQGDRGVEWLNGGDSITISHCLFDECLAEGFGGSNLDEVFISKNNFHSTGLVAGYGVVES